MLAGVVWTLFEPKQEEPFADVSRKRLTLILFQKFVTNREDSRPAGVDVIWLRQPRPAQWIVLGDCGTRT
jgi:hypothetical protein